MYEHVNHYKAYKGLTHDSFPPITVGVHSTLIDTSHVYKRANRVFCHTYGPDT